MSLKEVFDEFRSKLQNLISSEYLQMSTGDSVNKFADTLCTVFQASCNSKDIKTRLYNKNDVQYMVYVDEYNNVQYTPSVMHCDILIPGEVDLFLDPEALVDMVAANYKNMTKMHIDDDVPRFTESMDYIYHVESDADQADNSESHEDDMIDVYTVIMDYNFNKIPGKILELDYEEFRNKSDSNIRKMIEKDGYLADDIPDISDSDDESD